MSIFHPDSFSKSHLAEKQKLLRAQDLQTLEKCALALELVGRLQKEGLDFIFKGGTSLMLLFSMPKRLSIDVDILCLESLEKLNKVLDRVVAEAPFKRWTHQDHRDREAPPTKHFQVYYNPIVSQVHESSIQMDVIECENPYAQLIKQPVKAPFLEIEEEISITMPSASSLLGDKLAAFAPSTIGYPYQPFSRSGKAVEQRPIKVLKHLFDLGVLSELSEDITHTISTYKNIFAEQIRFRDLRITINDALDDTQDAAFWVSRVGGRKLPKDEVKLDYMAKGIKALGSHLFNDPFGHAAARTAAARAALIAEIVRKQDLKFDLRCAITSAPDIAYLKDTKLEAPWSDLNTIKGTNTDAYALWERAQNIS